MRFGGKISEDGTCHEYCIADRVFLLIPDISITAKQHNPAPRSVPLVRTAPLSVIGERQANYADEEHDHVDLQGKKAEQ